MSWLISKDKYRNFLATPSSKWRERGNTSFKLGRYDESIEEYTTALLLADNLTERPPCTAPAIVSSSVPHVTRFSAL